MSNFACVGFRGDFAGELLRLMGAESFVSEGLFSSPADARSIAAHDSQMAVPKPGQVLSAHVYVVGLLGERVVGRAARRCPLGPRDALLGRFRRGAN